MSVYRYYPVFSSVAKCRDIDEKMQLCCTAKRPFFSEREKRERQRRQETNRTAVRSVPITQAGDRGRSPDFGKPHRGKRHGRIYVE
ncbi:hypothetical protein RD871_002495 [Klebsiella pneumoniae]|uniref:hypothetical protein n=1 Tax=Klebsiella pneumoniae TaxID=573 RepID=UPI00111C4135|nr:hypothetical protein [Klebsiella pneumoniae]HCI6861584.1 hypothetical protein [Klebsiella quasipneumoniae subsp. similipneumoniae]EIX9652864.1 hypothetical protein [Klebsiella pneumoniae]EKZ1430985.1 hypothetical protein [Klebsiella pneumoniae]MBV5358654.1 hypothetical protein [Klebsiella pneumoniae]HBR3724033.1 hypothetical protein [Klebsiella pneumoniae]